ncbi:MAG: hypothetical protein Q8P57_02755 [Candidatus Pacearchaeota archaeon]|nr:hypothetical protein [Candidatus Pacearchaeota archaeon]
MIGKRGFLKIAEAGIAIMIIIASVLISLNKESPQNNPDLSETARDILREISQDKFLRIKALELSEPISSGDVYYFVNSTLPDYLNFEIRICDTDSVCGLSEYRDAEIYSAERIISSDSGPNKKLRLFIWEI